MKPANRTQSSRRIEPFRVDRLLEELRIAIAHDRPTQHSSDNGPRPDHIVSDWPPIA
jgi:hypothetical protein